MSTSIANAMSHVRKLSDADDVSAVGASIIARPGLSDADIERIDGSVRDGRVIRHRPGLSTDEKTWFDLKLV
jgi:hypothetical protein